MSDFFPNLKILRAIKYGFNTIDADPNDRISSLPDAILEDILTRIPIKSAVATSALSHRWRRCWTHTPHLIFNDAEILPRPSREGALDNNYVYPERLERFNTIVNTIMDQLNYQYITTFHYEFDCQHFCRPIKEVQSCSNLFKAWVPFLCYRNVVEFTVNFPYYPSYWPRFILPSRILECKSLVELTLRRGLYITYPTNGATLPKLKKLDLYCIQFDSDNAVQLLIYSCTLLEVFCLVLEEYKGDVLEISGHHLKSVTIKIWVDLKLVIDAPVLEEFYYMGGLDKPCIFVKFSSRLIKVKLNIWSLGGDELDYFDNLRSFLDGIYNAKYMHLDSGLSLFNALHYLNIDSIVDECRFTNLGHLSVDFDIDTQCQELVFESRPIPESLISKLKKIELFNIGSQDEQMIIELLAYILRKGDLLEKLYVSSGHRDIQSVFIDDREFKSQFLRLERNIIELLSNLPRSNPNCEIEFFGEYMCARLGATS